MKRPRKASVGTVVLDCAGLSKLAADDRTVALLIDELSGRGMQVVVSALTIIEATSARTNRKRMDWLLSGMRIESVDEDRARAASKLLRANNLHGHSHAIDAVVAELAGRQRAPVVLVTSDVNDMTTLCDDEILLIRT